jgi:predicted nucleotidyltransferase
VKWERTATRDDDRPQRFCGAGMASIGDGDLRQCRQCLCLRADRPVRRAETWDRCTSRPICETRSMDESFEAVTAEAVAVLRQAGARFAYLHGSRATGQNRADSDIDIAAYFGGRPPNSFDVLLPPGVDLLILDDAPLELAGRVAVGGRLLFEDDQVARVRWEAMTRKIYFDELPRIARSHREFAAAARARARAR